MKQFSNYLLVEIKRKGNPLLLDDPPVEALAMLGQLVLDNLKKLNRPVMVRLDNMGGKGE